MNICDIAVTCMACPLQIEGHWGRYPFYFRARHDRTQLRLGPKGGTIDDAVAGKVVIELPHDDWKPLEAVAWVLLVLEQNLGNMFAAESDVVDEMYERIGA